MPPARWLGPLRQPARIMDLPQGVQPAEGQPEAAAPPAGITKIVKTDAPPKQTQSIHGEGCCDAEATTAEAIPPNRSDCCSVSLSIYIIYIYIPLSPPSLSPSLPLSLPPSLSLSLLLTHSVTHSLCHSLSLSISPTLSPGGGGARSWMRS